MKTSAREEGAESFSLFQLLTVVASLFCFSKLRCRDKTSIRKFNFGVFTRPGPGVQPIILAIQEEPGRFDFYRNRPSFLPVHRYVSQEQLLADLGEKVIRPAELKVLDLRAST